MSSSRRAGASLAPDLVDPAFLSIPERSDSLGELAVSLAALCGLTLDPEQVLALDAILSTVVDGDEERFAALEAAIIEARQNGKTGGILLPIALLAAIRRPDQLIVWSAHRYKTSHEAFLAVLKLYKSVPELEARIAKVSFSNGEEAFEFHNGSRIIFIARSQAGGRGLTGDLVILDEALFLTPEMMGALMPTLSARPDPLVLYASSAGIAASAVLRDVRERGRATGDPSLVYVEWCAPDGGCAEQLCDHHRDRIGCALDDRENWRRANPAHVRGRISERYIAAERRSLNPREFARERLGWWDEAGAGGMFHMPSWWKRQDPETTAGPRLWFAAHVSLDRQWAAVGVASHRTDGKLHVEVIEHQAGTDWLLPYLVERVDRWKPRKVAVAAGMAAGSLVKDLERLRVFTALNTTETKRACAYFYDLVVAEDSPLAVRPNAALTASVDAAHRSSSRGEWLFDADPDVDLSPLYALALAVHVSRQGASRTDDELLGSAY